MERWLPALLNGRDETVLQHMCPLAHSDIPSAPALG